MRTCILCQFIAHVFINLDLSNMFNERSMQQQLKNFQKQSQIQPQRLQAQPFPACNIQPIAVMPQGQQQHFQQQQQGVYQQHYPQTLNTASSSAVRWQAQQPSQSRVPQNNLSNSTFLHHHLPLVQPQQHHPKSGLPPPKGGKHRAILLPAWLEKSICQSAQHSIRVESESLSQRAVRELYTRALGLVECTSFPASPDNCSSDAAPAPNTTSCGCCKQCTSLPTAWVETERVSLLLLRTGVPAGMLALLWELVNCSRPGQLTRRECAALLALIALVQSGQQLVSADVLLKLPEPVVPVIDHPVLLPFLNQFQQQQQFALLAKANNTAMGDNDDEFDDFVAATQPSTAVNTNNNIFFGGNSHSSGNCEQINSQGKTATTASKILPVIAHQPLLKQTFQSSLPLANLNQSNVSLAAIPTPSQSLSVPNTAGTDKHMNLPQVGRSPDMSPSLSFDNSQEDDFDDFQSATSDPSGLVSTDGSPRMVTAPKTNANAGSFNPNQDQENVVEENLSGSLAKLPGTVIRLSASTDNNASSSGSPGGSQTHSGTSSSNGMISRHLNSEKPLNNNLPKVAGGFLQPAKVTLQTLDGDRYAAIRAFDFGQDTSAPTLKGGGMDLLNEASTLTEDESFGDFCSVEKNASAVDDDFGDFAAANFEKLTMPDVLQSAKSLNNVIKQSNLLPFSVQSENPALDDPLHVDFDADFSSLNCDLHAKTSDSISDNHSLPNIPSKQALNTYDWTTGFDLKPSLTGITNFLAGTNKENTPDTLTTTTCSSGVGNGQDLAIPAVGKKPQFEKKSMTSSAGPSDWTDIFGVLHNHKHPAAAAAPQSLPVSVMPWSEEPPPLPNCGDNDDLTELNDDYGEFLGPKPSVPPDCEEAGSKGPALLFVVPQDNNDASASLSFPLSEPPTITTDCEISAPKLEIVETLAPAKGANVAAVLSTISEPLPLDKYSSIRENSNPCSGSGAEECWQRCLLGCQQLLRAGVVALEPLAAGHVDGHKLANTLPLRDYLAGLLEVVCVSARIRAAAHSLPVKDNLQASLSLVTDLQDKLVSSLQSVQDSVFVESVRCVDGSIPQPSYSLEPPGDLCAVCLTLISDGASSPSSHSPKLKSVLNSKQPYSPSPSVDPCRSSQVSCLQYGGHSYHPGCANLWLNCVDLTLPALTASSATLL